MHVAIDVAVWRIRSIGFVLIALGVIAAVVVRVSIGAFVTIIGVAIAFSRSYLIRRRAEEAYRAFEQTLDLMSLPHSGDSDRLTIDIGGYLEVRLRRIGRSSLLTFIPKHRSVEREAYLIRTLLKYQRSIRVIC
jgi:hypothetical protein